jgi:uncharacterized protein with FMN-binding domain
MRRVILAIIGTVTSVVMLLSFKTHSTATQTPTVAISTTGPGTGSTNSSGSSSTAAGSSSSASSSNSSSSASSTANSATGTTTVTGDAVDTRWGPVQVKITVTNGKLTAVAAVKYPTSNGRDQQINSYAIPALAQEALAAGNAQIDMISGATYTSQGYLGSLQSALDKAGL